MCLCASKKKKKKTQKTNNSNNKNKSKQQTLIRVTRCMCCIVLWSVWLYWEVYIPGIYVLHDIKLQWMNNWETEWRNTHQAWDEHIILERQVVQKFSNLSLLFPTLYPKLILDWLQLHQPTATSNPLTDALLCKSERGWPHEANS